MKKIVPFNNILDFDTDVCDITAISLEHNIKSSDDLISGEFYIMGEYKITDGQLEREKFDFVLPFDIALGTNYDRNTLVIDIDDFRYEIIERNKLKVSIDLYIDGEIISDEEVIMDREESIIDECSDMDSVYFEKEDSIDEEDMSEEKIIYDEEIEEELEEDDEIEQVLITERIDLLDEMLENKEGENVMDNTTNNININNNDNVDKIDIFNNSSDDKYVTYRVYRVMDNDTIDKIMEKYEISKEELSKYNELDMIKPGDKLIIPSISK